MRSQTGFRWARTRPSRSSTTAECKAAPRLYDRQAEILIQYIGGGCESLLFVDAHCGVVTVRAKLTKCPDEIVRPRVPTDGSHRSSLLSS